MKPNLRILNLESKKAGVRISLFEDGTIGIYPIERFTHVLNFQGFRPTTNKIEHHLYSNLRVKPNKDLHAASIHNNYLEDITGQPMEKFATRIMKNLKKEKVIQMDDLIE